jgi:hypothetical protein
MESDKRDAMAQEEETQTERELDRAKRELDPNGPGYAAEMVGAEPEEDDDSPPAT